MCFSDDAIMSIMNRGRNIQYFGSAYQVAAMTVHYRVLVLTGPKKNRAPSEEPLDWLHTNELRTDCKLPKDRQVDCPDKRSKINERF